MPHIALRFDEPWTDITDDALIHLPDADLAIMVLPGGMVSGKPSVALRINLPDGKVVIAETSWAILGVAARGIAARYGWPGD